MSKQKFIELIENFCALVGVDKAAQIISGESIVVNDVGFSFVHNDEVASNTLMIYADFGKIPDRKEAEVCIALLEANLYLYIDYGPIFMVSPTYKHVMCADRRMLGEFSAGQLLDCLKHLSATAKEWRTNYFLDVKPTSTQSGRGNLSFLRTQKTEIEPSK